MLKLLKDLTNDDLQWDIKIKIIWEWVETYWSNINNADDFEDLSLKRQYLYFKET
jgi:hypothetical protein